MKKFFLVLCIIVTACLIITSCVASHKLQSEKMIKTHEELLVNEENVYSKPMKIAEENSVYCYEVAERVELKLDKINQTAFTSESALILGNIDNEQRLICAKNGDVRQIQIPYSVLCFTTFDQKLLLLCKTEDGHAILTMTSDGNTITEKSVALENSSDAKSIVVDSFGKIYISEENQILVFDSNCKLEKELESDWQLLSLVQASDGSVYVQTAAAQGQSTDPSFLLMHIDLTNEKLEPVSSMNDDKHPLNDRPFSNCNNSNFHLLINGKDFLCGVSLTDGSITRLLSWADIGSECIVYGAAPIGNGFAAIVSSKDTGLPFFCYLLPTEHIKSVVELACIGYLDSEMTRAVQMFNSTNIEHIVEVTYYEETRLNLEFASGGSPDIIHLASHQYEQYVSKGLLLDLNEVMDGVQAPELNELLIGPIKAMSNDDSLYLIMPTYTISTMIGQRFAFENDGWNLVDVQSFLCDYPDFQLFANGELYIPMTTLLQYNLSSFIDFDKAQCSFESDDFIELMEVAKKCSASSDQHTKDSLVFAATIDSVENYYRQSVQYDSFAFVGYPANIGSGHCISAASCSYAFCKYGKKLRRCFGFFEFSFKSTISGASRNSSAIS